MNYLHIVLCKICFLQVIKFPYTKSTTEETLQKLKDNFLNNPMEDWIYKDRYLTLKQLGLHYLDVNRSIRYPRQPSNRMKNAFYRAINGENMNVALLGGSISAGATLFKDNNERKIFFYALQDYWNKTVTPITGSKMMIHNYAIGATGSDFYSYCIDNYVQGNATDLVIWELSANDYHRFDNRDVPPTLPLEILTRSVMRLKRKPGLLYAHFFRGKDYRKELECNNLESDGANYLSRYYRIPSISWKKLVCRKLILNEQKMFSKLFAQDSSHPSLLGHAQMGFLLIHLIRKLFIQVIDDVLSNLSQDYLSLPGTISLEPVVIEPMLKPVFTKTDLVASDPLCFTFNIPSNGQTPFNLKKILKVVRNDGYVISTAHGFIVRKDKTEGLRTKLPNKELHIQINVPTHQQTPSKEWMILIGSYSNFGGAMFFIDSKLSRVIETEKYAYGSIVAAVATKVKPGRHDLVIKSLKSGFFISSVMLG
ncbi:uncharacterized protein LOC124809274 [Hydra vulgaris]|uniref:Uncharacterized protein LOC124809274 n=1 Tax=Hydra vulgaris TaxID=6087 RepID=A0ABM4BL48_HYDVU